MSVDQFLSKRLLAVCLTMAALFNWVLLPASTSASAATAPELALSPTVGETARARARAAYGDLPMRFERNQGQFDERVRYAARGAGYALWLTADGAVLSLLGGARQPADDAAQDELAQAERSASAREAATAVIRMKLLNANPAANVTGTEEMAGRSNYFVGKDAAKWRAGVSNYARVAVRGVYRGVDMVYYGNGRQLEYDFNVAAGANPAAIGWRIAGAKRLRVDATGELVMATAAGEVRQHKPVAYQEINGERREVAARYVLRGKNRVSFALGHYDRRQPLVIDPVLGYSTYLGGSNDDEGHAIAVDGAGNAYVTGLTFSTDFPTASAVQPLGGALPDLFVAKLNANGTALVYSTYLGGSDYDDANSIAVDTVGNAYVTGFTQSLNFPTVNPLQSPHGNLISNSDAFVAKLNAAGTALVYSTYLGGNGRDKGLSIAVDATGNACVAGWTTSTDFQTVNALQATPGGNGDAFVSKLNAAGTAFVYSTYLGGDGGDWGAAIAVDNAGSVYVAGATNSPNFPLVNPIQSDFKCKTAFKTLDGAANWAAMNNGLPVYAEVDALAVDPQTPSTVYAATSPPGVYKSTDGGDTWSTSSNGLPQATLNALAVSPATPSTLFLATANGVYRSTDAGASWSVAGQSFGPAYSIAFDPVNPANVYVGRNNSVSKSTDGGNSWATPQFYGDGYLPGAVHAIAVDPNTPSTLYIGGKGIFKNTVGGGGDYWEPAGFVNSSQTIYSLTIDPTNSATIYAATSYHIYKSTDGSGTWSQLDNNPVQSIRALVINPAVTSTLYAAVYGGGVIKSMDGGGSWATVNNGLSNLLATALAIDPQNPSRLYTGAAVAGDGFVAKLDAAGAALTYSTYLGGNEADSCAAIAVDAGGNAYVTGPTTANDFPTVNPLQSYSGGNDVFVAKLNNTGTALAYSTYLGGSGYDTSYGLAIDGTGNAFVTGYTLSADFLATDPARTYADAFVAGLNPAGSALIYSTSLGGQTNEEAGKGIAIDPAGNVYVTGYTGAADFPVTPGAWQTVSHGYHDAFITKIAFTCSPSLAAASAAFTTRGGSGSVKVQAAAGCAWQATSNAGWIIIASARDGVGDSDVKFEVRENPDGAFRTGTLTVGEQTFTIYQAGAGSENCQVALNSAFAAYPASGGFGSTYVSAGAGCTWTAQTKASWITITPATNGTGSQLVNYTVAVNPSGAARKATIRIGGQTLSVKQKGH
ncbi:MAG TPA: SBBP repeat-containing protein [Blastocatellia bacterium]|nr:SBBP repeat-containing protein [Blastocatellia bacterium]